MDPQLRSQLCQTIRVARLVLDGLGGYTREGLREQAARVSGRMALRRDEAGLTVVPEHLIITDQAVAPDETVWLPGEDPDRDPGHSVQAVFERVDERGRPHHWEVRL